MSILTDEYISNLSDEGLDRLLSAIGIEESKKRAEEAQKLEQRMRVLDMQLVEDNIRGRNASTEIKIEYDAKIKKTTEIAASPLRKIDKNDKRRSRLVSRFSWA
ncbi:hypothetical protein BDZ45DRAFT_752688 [Acephala macrosclerotiorum]|nr:hypothetical protein BDZ45DRAFT_752688 [Acephala macrosclerotiorum]